MKNNAARSISSERQDGSRVGHPQPAPEVVRLTAEDLDKLKQPFQETKLKVKVQAINRQLGRALLVKYLEAWDVQSRLEEVDPCWTSQVLGEEQKGNKTYTRIRLTLKGVSRENVGEGADAREACADGIKRAAMLFGVGRYLYEGPSVWVKYDEQRDAFRRWTIQDYEAALHEQVSSEQTEQQPKPKPAPGPHTLTSRDELNRKLMALHRPFVRRFPATSFPEILQKRYGVPETRKMSEAQLEDLVRFMETWLHTKQDLSA